MVRNFVSANPECPSFNYFAQSFMFHFEKAADQCLINKRKSFMDSKGYGYEEMCNHFSNYYRKENTEGRWLPTQTVRGNHWS